jgi:hypothetical protein
MRKLLEAILIKKQQMDNLNCKHLPNLNSPHKTVNLWAILLGTVLWSIPPALLLYLGANVLIRLQYRFSLVTELPILLMVRASLKVCMD